MGGRRKRGRLRERETERDRDTDGILTQTSKAAEREGQRQRERENNVSKFVKLRFTANHMFSHLTSKEFRANTFVVAVS